MANENLKEVVTKFLQTPFVKGIDEFRVNKDATKMVETPFVDAIVALQGSGGMDSNEEVGNLLGTPIVQAILDMHSVYIQISK